MTDLKTFKKKIIIFPLEIKSRDLIPRLEIAAKFLEKKNFYVIIGEQTAIHKNIEKIPKGILFEKSISKLKEKRFKKFINLNFKICSLDEEGVGSYNNPIYYKKSRFSYYNLKIASKIFVWGNFEKKLILQNKKFNKFKNKIINSGHNKINIWIKNQQDLYKKENIFIKKKFNKYILITSNLAYPHRDGDEFLIMMFKKSNLMETKNDRKLIKDDMNYRKFIFKKYLRLIKKLSYNFPEKNIILRPHPSENIKEWKTYFKNLKNVKVIYKFDVSPWINNSEYFIHSSCTTGLEAYFRKKSPISFLPKYFKKNLFEKHISNNFSKIIRDENQIIDFIKNNKKNDNKYNFSKNKIFPNLYNKKNTINTIYKHINNLICKEQEIKLNSFNFFYQYIKEIFSYPFLKVQSLFDKNLKEKYYFRNEINKIKILNPKIKDKKIIFFQKNIFLIK